MIRYRRILMLAAVMAAASTALMGCAVGRGVQEVRNAIMPPPVTEAHQREGQARCTQQVSQEKLRSRARSTRVAVSP